MPARRLTASDTFTVETIEDGIGITSVTTYYLATSASSGVTRSTSGWTTTIQTITSTNKYLWMYEDTLYSDGTHSYTDPAIRGTYGEQGQQGQQGKMGRNIYYAGKWNDTDVNGQSFTVTDSKAPYVNIGTDDAPNCKVWVGENGNKTFPTTVAGYNNSDDWAAMDSNFKYLITKAMFSDYANLGSSVFNQDFMFSQYGLKVAYGHSEQTEDNSYYKYIDWTDIGAYSQPERTPSIVNAVTFTNASYASNYKIDLETASAGRDYMYAFKFTIPDNHVIGFKVATAYNADNILNDGVEFQLNSSMNGKYYYAYGFNNSQRNLYLFYRRVSGAAECKVLDVYKSLVKFRPNIYADWMKGFLFAQYGMFKNVVIQGVFNNLITEIDYDKDINSDLIITHTYDGVTKYYLDVLRCGNFVRIKSLPSGLGAESQYLRIPYFVDGSEYDRTKTRLAKDGTVLSNPRDITADEMRMLVGRKLVIVIDFTNIIFEHTYIKCHLCTPNGLEGSPSTSDLSFAIRNVANGQPYVNSGNGGLTDQSVSIGHKKTIYLECRLVTDTYSGSTYHYVWTQTNSQDVYSGDSIDDEW